MNGPIIVALIIGYRSIFEDKDVPELFFGIELLVVKLLLLLPLGLVVFCDEFELEHEAKLPEELRFEIGVKCSCSSDSFTAMSRGLFLLHLHPIVLKM